MAEDNIQNVITDNFGFGNNKGFLGRYHITNLGVEDLGRDLWQEGSNYQIHPFQSTKEDFVTKIFDLMIRISPKDIFRHIQNFTVQEMYIPMMQVDDKLISLYSKMPEMSFGFFKDGTCDLNKIHLFLGQPVIFCPHQLEYRDIEFQSIWLSVNDVEYVANAVGRKVNHNNPPLVEIIPIHFMEFDYKDKHYVILALGDRNISMEYFNIPLPEDSIMTSKKLAFNKPYISITLILAFTILFVYYVIKICFGLWQTMDMFALLKLVILCIPIAFIYQIAWALLRLIALFLEKTMLQLERGFAFICQRIAINKNLNLKKTDLGARFSHFKFSFPNVSDIGVDTSLLYESFEHLRERMCIDLRDVKK